MSQIVLNGVDYSHGSLTGQQLQDAGQAFCCRYLANDSRGLRQFEVDSFRAKDIGLVIIGEYDKIDNNGNQVSAMLGGSVAGAAQARFADALRANLGLPNQQPIYFTLDVEPGSIPWADVRAYLLAAAEALGGRHRVGIYAGYDGIDFCVVEDLADWFWQTYAWSGGRFHPKNHLYQYDIYGEYIDGIDVDLNKAYAEHYGQTQMFENNVPTPQWILPIHPDWFSSSLSIRYPTVGRFEWKGQTIVLDSIRHNAHTQRNTWQYAEPSTKSGHAGPQILKGRKVNVERIGEVDDEFGRPRTWVLTGQGTWIPEDTLDIDFTIKKKNKK